MPRRDRRLLRERWRTDLERGLAAPEPLRPRSCLRLDRTLQRGRTGRAELCRGDGVGDPPAKPADQGLHQHRVRTRTLSNLPLGDNSVGPLRTHSLPGARCRGPGSGPAGIHRHARGTQLRENACPGLLTREGKATRHREGRGLPSQPSYPAISDATSCGCDSIATWLAATSTTFALTRLAMLRCRAGWMARSFVATR